MNAKFKTKGRLITNYYLLNWKLLLFNHVKTLIIKVDLLLHLNHKLKFSFKICFLKKE